jgi:hypothetical protein
MTTYDSAIDAAGDIHYAGSAAARAQVRLLAAQLIGVPDQATVATVKSLRTDCPLPQARAFRCRLEPDVWRGISIVARGQPRAASLALVDLVRVALALDAHTRERTRAYGRRWKVRTFEDLCRVLTRIGDVAESALYLARYKPRGLIVTPPFGLTAEILLLASGERPVSDALLLDWFEGAP